MSNLGSLTGKLLVTTAMLLGLPLLGVYAAGYPVSRYLEFPPSTRFVAHASFSPALFTVVGLCVAAVTAALAIGLVVSYTRFRAKNRTPARGAFPWWGWAGVAGVACLWISAWTRFPWFEAFQPHTFAPLWLSFIVVINALTCRRTGRCMMIDRPLFFLCLFPTSAFFWWYFEFLNRFVQNWFYTGVHYGPWTYFLLATLSFSTVLPAVLGAQELVLSFEWIKKGFTFKPFPARAPRRLASVVLVMSGAGLAGIGVLPDFLFPLVWVSPLVIIVCLQVIQGEENILSQAARGRWYPMVSAALAALMCGWFWEMWNYWSLAKWQYAVPFLHRFPVFEMPILGYAGYLPFGMECLVVGMLVKRFLSGGRGGPPHEDYESYGGCRKFGRKPLVLIGWARRSPCASSEAVNLTGVTFPTAQWYEGRPPASPNRSQFSAIAARAKKKGRARWSPAKKATSSGA
jgi:hypothetical protein